MRNGVERRWLGREGGPIWLRRGKLRTHTTTISSRHLAAAAGAAAAAAADEHVRERGGTRERALIPVASARKGGAVDGCRGGRIMAKGDPRVLVRVDLVSLLDRERADGVAHDAIEAAGDRGARHVIQGRGARPREELRKLDTLELPDSRAWRTALLVRKSLSRRSGHPTKQ